MSGAGIHHIEEKGNSYPYIPWDVFRDERAEMNIIIDV